MVRLSRKSARVDTLIKNGSPYARKIVLSVVCRHVIGRELAVGQIEFRAVSRLSEIIKRIWIGCPAAERPKLRKEVRLGRHLSLNLDITGKTQSESASCFGSEKISNDLIVAIEGFGGYASCVGARIEAVGNVVC